MNVKKKGNKGENALATFLWENLKDVGGKFWRDNASGGGSRDKGDINNNMDVCIECKTVKAINLKSAWQQVTIASSKNGNAPVLMIHYDGMPKDTWLTVVHSDDFVYWFKNSYKYEKKL